MLANFNLSIVAVAISAHISRELFGGHGRRRRRQFGIVRGSVVACLDVFFEGVSEYREPILSWRAVVIQIEKGVCGRLGQACRHGVGKHNNAELLGRRKLNSCARTHKERATMTEDQVTGSIVVYIPAEPVIQ